ncbi:MAG: tRNA threonylcarbamoyladenosine dehydratase [Lachnospiraceae bacterium]|nr:tRNA threonylcarbamoyladenosine dehydratase [Lachnospiraceae bacterium]
MSSYFSRTELLLGPEAMRRLAAARVAVFGVGGVGGHVVEALARSGVGAIDLIDRDTVDATNVNRQIIATTLNIGQPKVDAARERVLAIHPDCRVTAHRVFFLPETEAQFDFTQYDYVVDAIDTVAGKLALILAAKAAGVPVISSMGAGNKLDPTRFEVADISETSVCPLARVMRRELKKRGVEHVKVVYSKEPPVVPREETEGHAGAGGDAADAPRVRTVGSVAFVPSVAGLIIAGEVVKDLIAAPDADRR